MKSALIATLLVLAGCAPQGASEVDQCMRRDLFKQCLAQIPAGPTSTVNNDWSEVVESCESAAYYQSVRAGSQIKPECKP